MRPVIGCGSAAGSCLPAAMTLLSSGPRSAACFSRIGRHKNGQPPGATPGRAESWWTALAAALPGWRESDQRGTGGPSPFVLCEEIRQIVSHDPAESAVQMEWLF